MTHAALTSRPSIWHGNREGVDEARASFDRSPSLTTFLAYACALYSFRLTEELLEQLERHGRTFFHAVQDQLPGTPDEIAEVARQCDMLATYFHSASRTVSDAKLKQTYSMRATMLATRGEELSEGLQYDAQQAHMWYLIRLTLAACLMDEAAREMGTRKARRDTVALHYLDRIAKEIVSGHGTISDPKQRVRVLAKLGALYRIAGNHRAGYYWGVRAATARRIPIFVRAKAFASLVPRLRR